MKLTSLLPLVLLVTAACTESPDDLERVGDLPVDVAASELDPNVAPTTTAASRCVLVSADTADLIARASQRARTLIDREAADGAPESVQLALDAGVALKEAQVAAATARDTLLDGPLSLDGDRRVTTPAEGAAVRALQHDVIVALERAVDLSVQRAAARKKPGSDAGVSAHQSAVLAGKALDLAQQLRARAVECELE